MLVGTAIGLATPRPLQVIIDNVLGQNKTSPWLADICRPWMDSKRQLHIAVVAAIALRRDRRVGSPSQLHRQLP